MARMTMISLTRNIISFVTFECILGSKAKPLKTVYIIISIITVFSVMTGCMLCPPVFRAAVSVLCQPLCRTLPSAALPGELALFP